MSHTQVLRHAIEAAKAGNPALAKIHLHKAAEADPDDPAVWLWMAWLSDSPLSMAQCLEIAVQDERYRDVAEAGIQFARTLAGFKVGEFGNVPVSAARPASDVQAEKSRETESDLNSIEAAVEKAAREIVDAPTMTDPPIDHNGTQTARHADANLVDSNQAPDLRSHAGSTPQDSHTNHPSFDQNDHAAFTPQLDGRQHATPAGNPATVWRAAQSNWFSLEPDHRAASAPPAVPTPAKPTPTVEPTRNLNARSVEVLIPEAPSIRTARPANVDAYQAESVSLQAPIGVLQQSHYGPVVAPRIPSSADAWGPMDFATVSRSDQRTTTHVERTSFNDSHQDSTFDFEALADESYGGLGPREPASEDGDVILVVDDSPTVRKLIAMTLEKRGYKVASAFDGLAAIKEIASRNPALILMDVNMPRLDGYQLCKLVKKHDSTRHIPVVLLTGKDGMFDRLRGRLVGCSGYIAKPFVPEELVATVEQFLAAAKRAR